MDEFLVKNDIINYQTSRNISIQYEEKLKLDLIIPNIAMKYLNKNVMVPLKGTLYVI